MNLDIGLVNDFITNHNAARELDRLLSMICRVANELDDPSGENWCDNPEADRKLLVSLRDDVKTFLTEESELYRYVQCDEEDY